MKHIKNWRVVGELTENELEWLFINKFDVNVERNEIHFTTLTGSHSRVTMPDVTKINIQTIGDTAEIMMLLKFSNRLVLIDEQWIDEYHGCKVEF